MNHRKIPIAIFVYNRPKHTEALFRSLAECVGLEHCIVHIYCDGPARNRRGDGVAAARDVVHFWARKLQAIVVCQENNLGLARSIVAGVSEACDKYGRVIVLEDDLVLHRTFLQFMIHCLNAYESDQRIFQISGYSFPLEAPAEIDTYLLPIATSWGWGTWSRAWSQFRWNPNEALASLADPAWRYRFDVDGSYPYSRMLKDTLCGKVDSWAIRWQYAVFRAGGLAVYPRQSLVWNSGFDNSGVHCREGMDRWQAALRSFRQEPFSVPPRLPKELQPSDAMRRELKHFLACTMTKRSDSILYRARSFLRKLWTMGRATAPIR
jgi:hypothetical protein